MENAGLVGLSRQIALQREFDVVANNIANLNTTGYKADNVTFGEYVMPVARANNFRGNDRLVSFTQTRPVAHVLGAHIEQTRYPFLDYVVGTQFQPEEHVLELGRAHLVELQDSLRGMSTLQRTWLRDFTIWPF